ncbi:hypothetical protein [Parafrankia sp. FMc2]|uniref:hypothetical protein n=1 Tax=Parafrankia sp. FMc2 TaxID=3233196 RepID=UPI0034D42F98
MGEESPVAAKDQEKIKKAIGPLGLVTPAGATARTQAPAPDATGDGPGVSARVWYGRGNKGLVRPVLLADGFNTGPTDNLPEIDGAPGGTLDSFGILADALKDAGESLDVAHRIVNFVPSVSAVALRDVETDDDLYLDINAADASRSELDEFLCSSRPTPHTMMTEELSAWILDRIAR